MRVLNQPHRRRNATGKLTACAAVLAALGLGVRLYRKKRISNKVMAHPGVLDIGDLLG